MMTDVYQVFTPAGSFNVAFGDEEDPVTEYQGDDLAIQFFKDWLLLNQISGEDGWRITPNCIDPSDLYGFCQPPGSGITVIPPFDHMIGYAEDDNNSGTVSNEILDSVDEGISKIDTRKAFDEFIKELDQCKDGVRGWVDCSKSRADKIGLSHGSLTMAAKQKGLQIERHGKYGYTASRKTLDNTEQEIDDMLNSQALDAVTGVEKIGLIKELKSIRADMTGKTGLEKLGMVKRLKEIRSVILGDSQDATDPNIGRTWHDRYGHEITIEFIKNGQYYTLQDGKIMGAPIIPIDRLEKTIEVDESWYQEKLKNEAKWAEEELLAKEAEDAKQAEYADITGTPLEKGRKIAALSKQVRISDGRILTIKKLIDELVANGANVVEKSFYNNNAGKDLPERVLMSQNGTFRDEKAIGKIGMDYAVDQIAKRSDSGVDQASVAKVDEAYQFNASDEFKEWLSESVAKPDYSPFVTAKAMTEAAKKNGATIEWGFFGSSVMDSIDTEEDATVEAVLDAVATLDSAEGESYVGKIIKSGVTVGRIDMGDDGKAMIFVGDSGDQRVKFNGRDAFYSDDDAPLMVDWLFNEVGNTIFTKENGVIEIEPVKASPLDEFENSGGEAWQVTQKKWIELMQGHYAFLGQDGNATEFSEFHKSMVKEAIDAGKPVSGDVLADYPGMKPETAEEKESRYRDAENNLNKLITTAAGGSPELIKQKTKLANLMQLQERMKAANKVVGNKKLSDEQKVAQLVAQGFSESSARELLKPDFAGRVGFASYELTNNNANIKRVRDRVQSLEAQELAKQAVETGDAQTSYKFDGGSIDLDYGDDRLRVYFGQKPDSATIQKLKSNGFKWSPTNMAWQRQLTDNAISTANYLFGTSIKTAGKMASEEQAKREEEANKVGTVTPVGNPIKDAFIAELESLKSETDIDRFNSRLDEIAARIEQAGLMEDLDVDLNAAADVLTELLAKAENA